MSKTPQSRRAFLQKMTVGITASALPITALQANQQPFEGKKLNVALCGLGRYAGYMADALQSSQYCKLAGLITGTPSKAESWGKQYNIPQKNIYSYQNLDEIAKNKDIDVVFLQ